MRIRELIGNLRFCELEIRLNRDFRQCSSRFSGIRDAVPMPATTVQAYCSLSIAGG